MVPAEAIWTLAQTSSDARDFRVGVRPSESAAQCGDRCFLDSIQMGNVQRLEGNSCSATDGRSDWSPSSTSAWITGRSAISSKIGGLKSSRDSLKACRSVNRVKRRGAHWLNEKLSLDPKQDQRPASNRCADRLNRGVGVGLAEDGGRRGCASGQ
jgi:hypothetical protein